MIDKKRQIDKIMKDRMINVNYSIEKERLEKILHESNEEDDSIVTTLLIEQIMTNFEELMSKFIVKEEDNGNVIYKAKFVVLDYKELMNIIKLTAELKDYERENLIRNIIRLFKHMNENEK